MKLTDNRYKTKLNAQGIIEYLIVLAAIITVIAICTGALQIGVVRGLGDVQEGINKYVQ